MNEENFVAGLGPPEAAAVSVVSPCRSVAPRASPWVDSIVLPLGAELGVFDPVTECSFFCHPAMTPLCLFFVRYDPDVCGRATTVTGMGRVIV